MRPLRALSAAALLLALASASAFAADPGKKPLHQHAPAGLDKIRHVLVIYLENRSFDNLYGGFPGANGANRMPPTRRKKRNSGGG